MSFLEISGLRKAFGDFLAVEHLDLQVEKGEFVSLLGPSGCGKTTTLQMIAGFLAPSKGDIRVNGHSILAQKPEKRGMGIVFQSYALFPHMTVAENVRFGLEMRGIKQSDCQLRVAETLEMVRLQGLDARYPRELSGGQRQRVAIARALAIRPAVLLLDEPMSNLDAKLRSEMHIELRAIQRQLGITTILVTHDQTEAMTMSDRIAVMHGGKIVQYDEPYAAYERPVSAFASNFLGKTNILSGQVSAQDGSTCMVQLQSLVVQVPCQGATLKSHVDVYIRPEKIRLAPHAEGRLTGRVITRLFLGDHWVLEVDTAHGPMRVSVPNIGKLTVQEGEDIGLTWADTDIRVLNKEQPHGH
ncbi:ABC transporter ATP-binding protein [Castellaniella sp.]|uniref:ABC transporter ATP-binding protein n=1 Tax=Castellaniella sp. TaxID=1955812 RepID=UPI003A8CFDED